SANEAIIDTEVLGPFGLVFDIPFEDVTCFNETGDAAGLPFDSSQCPPVGDLDAGALGEIARFHFVGFDMVFHTTVNPGRDSQWGPEERGDFGLGEDQLEFPDVVGVPDQTGVRKDDVVYSIPV